MTFRRSYTDVLQTGLHMSFGGIGVNEEYQDLHGNRTQDLSDLNESPSNVRRGIGVFSAFNSERYEFVVARDPETT